MIVYDANPQDLASWSWHVQHRDVFGSEEKVKVILQFEKLQSVNTQVHGTAPLAKAERVGLKQEWLPGTKVFIGAPRLLSVGLQGKQKCLSLVFFHTRCKVKCVNLR